MFILSKDAESYLTLQQTTGRQIRIHWHKWDEFEGDDDKDEDLGEFSLDELAQLTTQASGVNIPTVISPKVKERFAFLKKRKS